MAQLVQFPAEEEPAALLKFTEANEPIRAPVTFNVQAEPGLRLMRLALEVPVKDAAPVTVKERPAKPVSELVVPLVNVKFPLVTIFWPLKSSMPAFWEKDAQ